MTIIIRWLFLAVALWGIASIVPGIELSGMYAALITIVILGLVNAVIRPLFVLLTLPINILTLGLFTFVINALLFWFVSTVVDGFTVEGFLNAFIGALAMTVFSAIINLLLKKE